MARVKITGDLNSYITKISVDGQELTSVRAINYSVSVGEIPIVEAEIILNQTDIEVDALLNLYANVNGKRYKMVEEEA